MIFASQAYAEKIEHTNFRTATRGQELEMSGPKKRVGVLSLQFTYKFRNTAEKHFKLAEESSIDPLAYYNSRSFIARSYVSWLQDQDVEVVPIDINLSDETISNILGTLNGIVLTGGANSLFDLNQTIQLEGGNSIAKAIYKPSYYLLKVRSIIEAAKKINETRKFAIWATCLGFESLLVSQTNNSMNLDSIHNIDHSAPITFINDEESSFLQYMNNNADIKEKLHGNFKIRINQSLPMKQKITMLANDP